MTLAPALECLLVADDLTGACDAAVHFALHGLRPTTVVLDQAPTVSARVLAVSTESRDLPPEEIRRAMSAVADRYPVGAGTLIFKKLDSTLRGNAGLEIAAALDAFYCDAAVVCPAFPKMQRVVERGFLKVTGAPEFVPVDVADRLQSQSRRPCAHIGWEGAAASLASGATLVSLDATCDRDLDCAVAAIVPTGRRILWAGSAGLASALARRLGGTGAPQPAPTRRGATLFCLGSDHDVTLGQQSRLQEGRPCVLLHPQETTRHAIAATLANGNHVILRIPRGQSRLRNGCAISLPARRPRPWSSPAATRHRWSAAPPA